MKYNDVTTNVLCVYCGVTVGVSNGKTRRHEMGYRGVAHGKTGRRAPICRGSRVLYGTGTTIARMSGYKVLSISVYPQDITLMDDKVRAMRAAGHRANRSSLIRAAIAAYQVPS